MEKVTTYNFEVKLEYLDEYKDKHELNYYCVPFQVLADDKFEAQRILEDWLSNPEQTGWKYKTWVGITPLTSNSIIINPEYKIDDSLPGEGEEDNLKDYRLKELLRNAIIAYEFELEQQDYETEEELHSVLLNEFGMNETEYQEILKG